MEACNHMAGTVAVCFLNMIIVLSPRWMVTNCFVHLTLLMTPGSVVASLRYLWNEKRLTTGTARKTGLPLFT
jgi:hypothetical protein